MDAFIVWEWKNHQFIQQKHTGALEMRAPLGVTGQRVSPPWEELIKQKLISAVADSAVPAVLLGRRLRGGFQRGGPFPPFLTKCSPRVTAPAEVQPGCGRGDERRPAGGPPSS